MSLFYMEQRQPDVTILTQKLLQPLQLVYRFVLTLKITIFHSRGHRGIDILLYPIETQFVGVCVCVCVCV